LEEKRFNKKMRTTKRNLRYILLSALVVLSLTLPSCSIFTWPSKLVGEVEELATKAVPEAVEVTREVVIEKPVVETVVVEKEVPVEVTRIVEVEKEVPVTPTPPAQPAETPPPPAALSQLDVESQILIEVYRKVNPSVVNVANLAQVEVFTEEEVIPQGEGSGFMWDERGHIVTNAHVVQGADKVQVTLYNDLTLPAQVVGMDPNSDLAVVKIDPQGLDLHPVELGDIDEVEVGQRAIAIGNPFRKANTMTQGIVSAVGRTIPSLTRYQIPEAIQTDAAINPGNSGGPLLDSEGRVIGVNAQIETGSSFVRANAGVGFAIPVSIVKRVVPALIAEGHYDHAWLGISGQTYSPSWAEELGFSEDARGAYVMEVVSGGPADEAGLQGGTRQTDILLGLDDFQQPIYLPAGGDLVVAIDDQPVEKFDDILVYLERYTSPGDRVELTVLHSDGQQEIIPIKLGKRPESQQ
jgi:S1-C subfamily serine protease